MTDRYDFGRNWNSFAEGLDDKAIRHAEDNFQRLVGDVAGCSFLDIGSGSGLHSLCALRLGASSVTAYDYDLDSVATTRAVLGRFGDSGQWKAERGDILDPTTIDPGPYDVVYSWGVLHHTGDMWQAIDNAAGFVRENGMFAIALYMKTALCPFWVAEKRLYSRHRWVRPFVRNTFAPALLAGHLLRGRNPVSFITKYKEQRGMSFMHDVDDWLGGYPYQSVAEEKLLPFMEARGFEKVRDFNTRGGIGVFGTGCGEWLFRRK